ncbi:MAG TPA: PGPGW domain-containing protein [Lacipirellula sp.]
MTIRAAGLPFAWHSGMFRQFRTLSHEFRKAPCGERFQRLYHRREARQCGPITRSFFLGTGLTIMALGLLLMPAPGPGTVVLIIGAAIAAQESLRVARVMDRCESRLTDSVRRVLQWWRSRSTGAKALVIATTAGSTAWLGVAGFRMVASIFAGEF